MIRMIIVEDEPLMNEYLAGCLEWNKFGILLCGVFFNGKAAYDFLQENEIDIVVTDIKMPVMDGLTLISKLAPVQPHLKFIIISGYNDFHMVKDAFKLGATDYVLKTEFEPETFQRLLTKLIANLSPTYEQDGISPAMREVQLRQFFWGSHGGKSLPPTMRIQPGEPLAVAVLRILNYDTIITNQWNVEKELMKYGLSNCIEEILEGAQTGEFFFNTYDEIIFLLPDMKESEQAALLRMLDQLFTVMKVNFGLRIACGVCQPEQKDDLKTQYQKAVSALEYTFIEGLSRPVLYRAICKNCDLLHTAQLYQEADDCIKAFDFETIMQQVERVEAARPTPEAVAGVVDYYKKLLLRLLGSANSYGFEEHRSFHEITGELYTAHDYVAVIRDVVLQLSGKKTYQNVIISQVQDYIQKNFSRNITLQLLAKEFNFDYTDLSRRFQKVTGKSFRSFLTEVRLNEAMELIRTTDFKLVEISSMVGYNNYENFSRSFKKKFKKWPNEIRKADT